MSNCFCGAAETYANCCEPLHRGLRFANSPEHLMRSRYSAYATQNYGYILATYTDAERQKLSIEELSQSDLKTQWAHLTIVASNGHQVEFKAFYQVGQDYYVLHELSDFVLENQQWRYSHGEIKAAEKLTLSRNDLCFCGSGKKFKRCHA